MFKEVDGVDFFDVRIVDIVHNIMSLRPLAANRRETYARLIKVTQKIMKHKVFFLFL